MGNYKLKLEKLLAKGITSPPEVKYSLRHRERIDYQQELDNILAREESRKKKKEQRDSDRKQSSKSSSSTRPSANEPLKESDAQNKPASLPTTKLSDKPVRRVSSEQAASVIATASSELLIVTTDASAGCHLTGTSGSAAILRLCRGQSSHDHVKAVVKYFPWAEAPPAEIAAVALACDVAVDEGIANDVRVLFIMDSQLDFYDPTRKANKLELELESAEEYKESMARLVQVSSCVMITKVKSHHSGYGGFLDHKAADKLANEARKNKEWSMSFHFDWVRNVPRLDGISMEWLRSSGRQNPTVGDMNGRQKLNYQALVRQFLNQKQAPWESQVQKPARNPLPTPGTGSKVVERILPLRAASIIEQAQNDLLVITVNAASLKATNTCFCAAILRLIQGKPGTDHVKALVKLARGPKEGAAQIYAVTNACNVAFQEGIACGRRVLIVMQSELNFYDSASFHPLEASLDFTRINKKSMARLLQISSSVMITKVVAHRDKSRGGFFDHKAARVLSEKALENEKWASSFKHDWVYDVPRLAEDNISMEWLRTSENIVAKAENIDATGRPGLSFRDRVQYLLDIPL